MNQRFLLKPGRGSEKQEKKARVYMTCMDVECLAEAADEDAARQLSICHIGSAKENWHPYADFVHR